MRTSGAQPSRRTLRQRLQDNLSEFGGGAIIAVLWLLAIKLVIAALVGLYLLVRLVGDGAFGAVIVLLALCGLVTFVLSTRGGVGRF